MTTDGGPETLQAEIVAIERGQQLKTQEAIAEAERRAELLAKVTIVAVKRTYPQDWIDFKTGDKGTPYLAAVGAERLRTLFGISITDLDVKRYEERDKEGVYYFYVVTGIAHWRGDEVAVMGTCSSRDLFFRSRYQDGEKVLLPADEIDPTNIVKAARSNMIANAVTGILGLRGLTWEQLKDLGVERGKGGTATFQRRKAAAPERAAAEKTESKIDALAKRLEEIAPGDATAQSSILVGVTAYEAGTRKDNKKPYKAFPGWTTVDRLRSARNPEQTAAIALEKIAKLIEAGELAARPGTPAAPGPQPAGEEPDDGDRAQD